MATVLREGKLSSTSLKSCPCVTSCPWRIDWVNTNYILSISSQSISESHIHDSRQESLIWFNIFFSFKQRGMQAKITFSKHWKKIYFFSKSRMWTYYVVSTGTTDTKFYICDVCLLFSPKQLSNDQILKDKHVFVE